ncbi:MAG: hypothetical protein JXJ19_03385 [Elusimicrobia bacterium]|nr:hypothetical protein [Elusimicrobiota bacterium]
MNEQKVKVKYTEDGVDYSLTEKDFIKVEEYCENECMGYRFLLNAEILRKMIRNLAGQGAPAPYTLDDLADSTKYETGPGEELIKEIKSKLGTGDLRLVAKIVIKQTYKFLYKI